MASLLSHKIPRFLFPLVKDGDLLSTMHSMLCLRGFDTVRVFDDQSHAARAMVDGGDVRFDHLLGNNGADAVADLGRLQKRRMMSSLLVVKTSWFVVFGVSSFSILKNSWLLILVLR